MHLLPFYPYTHTHTPKLQIFSHSVAGRVGCQKVLNIYGDFQMEYVITFLAKVQCEW